MLCRCVQLLNDEGPILLRDLQAMAGGSKHPLRRLLPAHTPVSADSMEHSNEQAESTSTVLHLAGVQTQVPVLETQPDKDQPQVPGYTTVDDAGNDGDDTIHQPIKFYNVPNVIGTNVSFAKPEYAQPFEPENVNYLPVHINEPETVDLIYNDFIQNWILLALRYLGEKREVADTESALQGKPMTDVISD